ncbi:proline--tRNA ligase, partial [Candidatus Saccharibacteria bacterium]|nr:proline--tRNA ligase [Candidatus Saccharibacteria bacterium]
YHCINVNWGRDLPLPEKLYDVKMAKSGDIHPETGKVYTTFKGVEVGNIFPLETKFTDALDLYYSDETGERKQIIMGSYGIGVSRLMGVIAEHFADDKGLVWPENIAPFLVYLVQIGTDEAVAQAAKNLYTELAAKGIEVLWDDRDARPGEKFADADLYGIPYRIVVSNKTLQSNQYEVKKRSEKDSEMISKEKLVNMFTT